MQVTSYQMHSMLESYSRKLSRARRTDDGPVGAGRGESLLSAEGSRQATMDKISRQVLDRISDVVSLSRPGGSKQPENAGANADTPRAPSAGVSGRSDDGVGDTAAVQREAAKTDSWV